MKKLVLSFLIICCCLSLWAQREETLFGRSRVIGAFGAPIVEFGIGNGDHLATSTGGGGALIIDNFFVGGYGMSSVDLEEIIDSPDRLSVDIAHGGLWFGYTSPSYKLLHFYSSVKLGWGAADIYIDDDDFDYSDGIFVVTPEAGLEVNVFRWFKIAGTVGYRFVDGISDPGLKKDDFTGSVARLTFRFGGFGNWNRWGE